MLGLCYRFYSCFIFLLMSLISKLNGSFLISLIAEVTNSSLDGKSSGRQFPSSMGKSSPIKHLSVKSDKLRMYCSPSSSFTSCWPSAYQFRCLKFVGSIGESIFCGFSLISKIWYVFLTPHLLYSMVSVFAKS